MLEIVRWLETELFNDWSIAHEFKHVVPLCELNLTSETLRNGDISHLLRGLRSEHGNLDVTLHSAFQQFPGVVWFYGGWIDQAVFTLRCVRGGSLRLLWEISSLIDSDPIEEAGDAVIGCSDWQHQLVFLVEVSCEARTLKLSLRTDSSETHKHLCIRPNALTNVA